jgi:transcription-repair coupling factor (superfamily II helicase)
MPHTFYNDLVSLLGDDTVFFFPSTYKRSVQYEQTEPANIVLRTGVLNHLASGKRKGIIVTYPESVMEKVMSRKNLKKNTLNIGKETGSHWSSLRRCFMNIISQGPILSMNRDNIP